VAGARRAPIKRTKNGRLQMGGRFISAARAKAIRAARRRAAAARSHTGIKPKPKRRNPPKKKRTAVKRRPAARKTTRTNSRARATAARKAAATRRSKALARSAAAKKAAATRRRNARKTTTVRSNPKRRKPVARKRRRTRSKASYAAAGRKAARTRAAKKSKRSRAGKKGARKRRRTKSGRFTRKTVRGNPPKRRKRRSRKGAVRYSRQKMRMRPAPYKRKRPYRMGRKTVRSKRTGRKHYRYQPKRVSRNPMTAMKAALKNTMPVFGGLLAIRVINGLLKGPLAGVTASSPMLAKYGSLIAPAVSFIGACWLGPKVLKGKPRFVQGLQIGATIALGDALIKQFVIPMSLTMQPGVAKNVVGSLAGYDDMGVLGYGAYIGDPTGYSLPSQHAQDISGYGLDVQEAMALDEYVPEGYGLDVEEALAGTEEQYLQTGGARGALFGTVFSNK